MAMRVQAALISRRQFLKQSNINKMNLRTYKHLKLHRKAIDILEMIKTCDERVEDSRNCLERSVASMWHHATKKHYEDRIKKYTAVKKRLTAYYSDILQRIIDPVLNNAVLLATIIVHENGVAEAV